MSQYVHRALVFGGYSVKLVFFLLVFESSNRVSGGGRKCVSGLKALEFKLKTDEQKNCHVPG